MTPFEQEMVQVITELLSEFGWAATLRKVASPTSINRNTLEVVSPADLQFSALAMFYDPTTSSLSGYENELPADATSGRKWMIVQSEFAAVETGDFIESPEKGKMQIDKVSVVGPSAALYYKVSVEVI